MKTFTAIHGCSREELDNWIAAQGMPSYRSRQIWNWLYTRRETDFSRMVNLPLELRERLASTFDPEPLALQEMPKSSDGVQKLLLSTRDEEVIETVIIPAAARRTICVSTQIGCPLGCVFCASALGGFVRDLTAGEIVAQVIAAARQINARPTHIVFMGMGEPLLNLDAVLASLKIMNDADGLGIAARRITISTSGVVPGIRRLAEAGMQFELSVSLHAPDDAMRDRLMPINRRWPITTLLDACRDYGKATGRLITFEYTLVEGLNDGPCHVRALLRLLRTLPCRMNVIPLSPVPGFEGRAPAPDQIQRFRDHIRRGGINVTVRQSRGADIEGACGQLRRRAKQELTVSNSSRNGTSPK